MLSLSDKLPWPAMAVISISSPPAKAEHSSDRAIPFYPLTRRNGDSDQNKSHKLPAGEVAGLAIFIVAVFSIGVGLVIYRNKKNAARQRTLEASRKRAGKAPVQKTQNRSARIPQGQANLEELHRDEAQPPYVQYWNENERPQWAATHAHSNGVVIRSICGCEACRTSMEGLLWGRVPGREG